jgi:hypothetical protein
LSSTKKKQATKEKEKKKTWPLILLQIELVDSERFKHLVTPFARCFVFLKPKYKNKKNVKKTISRRCFEHLFTHLRIPASKKTGKTPHSNDQNSLFEVLGVNRKEKKKGKILARCTVSNS